MKGRCMLLAAVAVAVAATFATPSSAQADRAGAPVVVAAVPVSMAFGTNIVAPRWEVRLDTCANPPPCPVDVDFTVGEIQSGSAGAILWADQSSAGFRTLTAYLTDGTSNLLGWGVLAPISPSFAVGTESFTTESMFLNSDPSGSDLQGWSLSRIGFAVEAATIDSPGQDLNHDGIWQTSTSAASSSLRPYSSTTRTAWTTSGAHFAGLTCHRSATSANASATWSAYRRSNQSSFRAFRGGERTASASDGFPSTRPRFTVRLSAELCGWPRTPPANSRTCRSRTLQLVHLYFERGSPKAQPAARRWLVRYLSEGTPSLRDVAKVTASLAEARSRRAG